MYFIDVSLVLMWRTFCVEKDWCKGAMTRRDREVVDFTWSHVKNNSELTNLMKMYRIEGYNGK